MEQPENDNPRVPKFHEGDTVEVINYGHPIWFHKFYKEIPAHWPTIYEDDKLIWKDMQAGIVGKKGVVSEVSVTQNIPKYALSGISGKTAWFDEQQLKLV